MEIRSESGFCEYIEISSYDKTCLRLFMLNKGSRKIIFDDYKLIFRPDKLPNYDIDKWSFLFTIFDVK